MATAATGGGVTVMEALPATPSIVAVISTFPAVTPVTRPEVLIVAALTLLELHVTRRPLMTPPVASCADAESCDVPATMTVAADGVTLTVATTIGSSPPHATMKIPNAAGAHERHRDATARTMRRSVPYEDKMDMGRG